MDDKLMQSWQQTKLWAELEGRPGPQAQEARRILQSCLPDVESILHSGGTPPLDFTLHDEQHSFRVAERMMEVIPRDVLPALSELNTTS